MGRRSRVIDDESTIDAQRMFNCRAKRCPMGSRHVHIRKPCLLKKRLLKRIRLVAIRGRKRYPMRTITATAGHY